MLSGLNMVSCDVSGGPGFMGPFNDPKWTQFTTHNLQISFFVSCYYITYRIQMLKNLPKFPGENIGQTPVYDAQICMHFNP